MKLDASDEQVQLQAITRRFLESTVPLTMVRLLGEKSPAGFDRDWWGRASELGWTSLLVPEDFGGSNGGTGFADLAIVAEEYGRLVSPGPLLPTSVVAWSLVHGDDPEAGQALLDDVMSGQVLWAWVVGEGTPPGVASPPSVRAEISGTSLELSGRAHAIESGADADQLLVAVALGDGVAHVMVTGDAPGLTRTRTSSLDLVRRYADLDFDRVVIPATAVVIGAERGRAIFERQGQIANVIQCAEMVGAATRAFDMTREYIGDRHSFGRPLASYQVLKHRMADMKLWLEASQAAVDGAAGGLDADGPTAAELVSTAKLYIGRKSTDIVQDCVQMHGGIGVTWEQDLHLYLRRVTVDRQLLGTPADHALHLATLIGL